MPIPVSIIEEIAKVIWIGYKTIVLYYVRNNCQYCKNISTE